MPISTDAIAAFKATQRQTWPSFVQLEVFTTPPAAALVRHAGIRAGDRVLDVACGTGVVSITAATRGATVTGLDLTPELLARARENAAIAGVTIDFHEGDVEALPFPDASFDVVTSQFGHIFAPRPEVAIREMLRVLAPGGTVAFSTWPPELFVGRLLALVGRYAPPAFPGIPPPSQWGDATVVRERLGDGVRDIWFDCGTSLVPALTPASSRAAIEKTSGPVIRLAETLSAEPARLETFRRELEALVTEYWDDNVVRQGFLMTRATKVS